jgi:hypothetical protein
MQHGRLHSFRRVCVTAEVTAWANLPTPSVEWQVVVYLRPNELERNFVCQNRTAVCSPWHIGKHWHTPDVLWIRNEGMDDPAVSNCSGMAGDGCSG